MSKLKVLAQWACDWNPKTKETEPNAATEQLIYWNGNYYTRIIFENKAYNRTKINFQDAPEFLKSLIAAYRRNYNLKKGDQVVLVAEEHNTRVPLAIRGKSGVIDDMPKKNNGYSYRVRLDADKMYYLLDIDEIRKAY